MSLLRSLRHLCTTRAATRRHFPPAVDAQIEAAIRAVEARTAGEVRLVIESALDLDDLLAGTSPRERALHVFSALHVWNTELRSGVLIYILMADRDVEIVADRGAAAAVGAAEWEAVCRLMEGHFRERRFAEGAAAGIAAVGDLLARPFPARPRDRDELPNQPVLL